MLHTELPTVPPKRETNDHTIYIRVETLETLETLETIAPRNPSVI